MTENFVPQQLLVVGGCGYIGSHMVKRLRSMGHRVTVLDNLSTGYLDSIGTCDFVKLDIDDRFGLRYLFSKNRFDAVFHFASFIQVGESVKNPSKYYRNNVSASLTLLEEMRQGGVRRLIFSSTAAVYGIPKKIPIPETHPLDPINPYGMSKCVVESMLKDFDRAYGLSSVCLRYFNAAGADSDGQIGERHDPETHLIPLVLQAASGRRSHIDVHGDDYGTPDGTCIRDYVHVEDLVDAHVRALNYLNSGGFSCAFNLGNGSGFSVQDVIHMAQTVTGKPIPVHMGPRREGDPSHLVADARLAREILGWTPQKDLRAIIEDAWRWELRWPW